MDVMILLAILLFVMAVILFTIANQAKTSSWDGLVVHKYETFDPYKQQTIYNVVFRTTLNKVIEMDLGQAQYNQYQIGDRVIKKKGEFVPRHMNL